MCVHTPTMPLNTTDGKTQRSPTKGRDRIGGSFAAGQDAHHRKDAVTNHGHAGEAGDDQFGGLGRHRRGGCLQAHGKVVEVDNKFHEPG